jgi:hypothetical protein
MMSNKRKPGIETFPDLPATPNLNKVAASRDDARVIGQFLEWLRDERELTIAEWLNREDLVPARIGTERLLHEYFKIDEEKLEQERRSILDTYRKRGWV